MDPLVYDEIKTEYDSDSRSYYVIWQPLATVGMGNTEKEALEDLRAAAHFVVETMVDLKLKEINPKTCQEGE